MGKRRPYVDPDLTFVPRISETSRRIATRRLEHLNTQGVPHFMLPILEVQRHTQKPLAPISNRSEKSKKSELNIINDRESRYPLHGPQKDANVYSMSKNDETQATKISDTDEAVITFRPKVSNNSSKIVQNLPSNFLARQQQHLDKQKRYIQQASLHFKSTAEIFGQSGARKSSNKEKASKDGEELSNDSLEGTTDGSTDTVTNQMNDTSNNNQSQAMPAAAPSLINRSKTHMSPSLHRILNGPYASSSSELVMKQHRPRQMQTSATKTVSYSLSADPNNFQCAEKDTSKSMDGSLSLGPLRSNTMPTLARHKGSSKKQSTSHGERKLHNSNIDRLKFAREIAEKAIKYKKVFTIQGGYSKVRQCLRRRGWVEKFYRTSGLPKRPTKIKKKKTSDDDDDDDDDDDIDVDTDDDNDETVKVAPWDEDEGLYGIMSRIVRNVNPTFIWVLKRDVIDHRFLTQDQMVNHFCKAGSFTTKVGLSVNMRNVPWFENADPDAFYPRCYRLGHNEDRATFIDDYRLTACKSILKLVVIQFSSQKDEEAVDMETEGSEAAPGESSTPRKADNAEAAGSKTEENSLKAKAVQSVEKRLKKKKKPIVTMQLVDMAIQQCARFLLFKEHEDIDMMLDPYKLSEAQWDQLLQWYYQLAHDGGVFPKITQDKANECENLINKLKDRCIQFDLDGVKNVWIVKPGAKSRGRGIFCCHKLDEMLKLISTQAVNKEGKFVVQKYIERPFLIHNCKFDIRQWFLVTDWNPLTLWFYQDSYIRFCSQQFTLEKFDEAIHLSNNAVQKHYKNGPRSHNLPTNNMWSHFQLKDYLRDIKKQSDVWEELIYPSMKKAIICSLLSTQDIVEMRKSSFELYGADFMLTEDCKPWLIEINSSPSMESSTPITARLCSNVLEDTIKVAVDRRYDRNSDTGRFELAYKQPMVAHPPYIGINLTVEGQSIRKPAPCARKSCEALVTNDRKDTKSPVEESSVDDKASTDSKSSTDDDRKENEQPDSEKTEKKEKHSNKQTISKSPGVHSMQNNVHRSSNNSPSSSRVMNLSAKSASTINTLIDPSVIKTIVASPAELYSSQSVSSSMPSTGTHIIPFPIPRTKTTSFTPLQIMNNARRAITRGSVGTNTLPSSFPPPTTTLDKLDKVAPPATTTADTTDTKHRGMNPFIDGVWARTCQECGSGMNLHLVGTNPKCKCTRDSIKITPCRERGVSARGYRSRPQSRNSKSPRQPSSGKALSRKGSPSDSSKGEKILLRYTDGGIRRPISPIFMNPAPKLVSKFLGRKTSSNQETSVAQTVYIDTSRANNQLSIVNQGFYR